MCKNMKRHLSAACCGYWGNTTNCKRVRRCKLGLFGKKGKPKQRKDIMMIVLFQKYKITPNPYIFGCLSW